jgi:hypothetical protein
MGPFLLAWLVGEGIIIYRSVKVQKAPPGPGQLLFTSGLFVLLALLAESEKARPLATTVAWGYDIAAYMNLFPSVTTGGAGNQGLGKWPPTLAGNTVIIPDGKTGHNEPTSGPAPSEQQGTSPSNPFPAVPIPPATPTPTQPGPLAV